MGAVISPGANFAVRENYTGKVVRVHGKAYTFKRRLGAGGFGVVYSARAQNGRNVAIKIIDINSMGSAGQNLVASYLTEVKNLEVLRKESRHVVRIFDFDFDSRSGRAYIVMELGGDNLAKVIERLHSSGNGVGSGAYIHPTARKEIWRQMASIVNTLTANNIVHMDLKPDNLILFGQTLKIADLGISKKTNMIGSPGVGTPFFSAPEVMQDRGRGRQYGPKADVWSLGATLYFMTYGKAPEYTSNAAEPPPGRTPAHDRALVDILRRTLVVDPHRRADILTVLNHPYTRR